MGIGYLLWISGPGVERIMLIKNISASILCQNIKEPSYISNGGPAKAAELVCFDRDVKDLSPSWCFQVLETASCSNLISTLHPSVPFPVLQTLRQPEPHLQLPRLLSHPAENAWNPTSWKVTHENSEKNPVLLKTPIFEANYVLSRRGHLGHTVLIALETGQGCGHILFWNGTARCLLP